MPAKTLPPKKRQGRALNTENKVLFAAERLLREEGIEAAQVDKIVRESGVSVGSIYHHFGSKEGVIGRLVERFSEEGRAQVDALNLNELSPDQALLAVLNAGLSRFRENPELYHAMASRMEKEPELWQPMRELRFYHESCLLDALGDHLVDMGITNPAHAISKMMQAVLALLTHTVIFDSGPIRLNDKTTSREIFDLAKAVLELEAKRQSRGLK